MEVDVAEDSQLWGRQNDRTSADLITVQEEIATAVSEQLRLATSTDEQRLLTKRSTENPRGPPVCRSVRYCVDLRRTG